MPHCYSVLLGREAGYCDQFVCLAVSVCVCLSANIYLEPLTDLHEIFYADPLLPWLGLSLAGLGYVKYFRFSWMTLRSVVVGRMAMHGRLNL